MIYITFFIVILIDKRDDKRDDTKNEYTYDTHTIHQRQKRQAPSGKHTAQRKKGMAPHRYPLHTATPHAYTAAHHRHTTPTPPTGTPTKNVHPQAHAGAHAATHGGAQARSG